MLKFKGVDLKGEQGVVKEIDDTYQGVPISSTLPVLVEFSKTPEVRLLSARNAKVTFLL